MNTKITLAVGVANLAAVLLTLHAYDANAQPSFTFTDITVLGNIYPAIDFPGAHETNPIGTNNRAETARVAKL